MTTQTIFRDPALPACLLPVPVGVGLGGRSSGQVPHCAGLSRSSTPVPVPVLMPASYPGLLLPGLQRYRRLLCSLALSRAVHGVASTRPAGKETPPPKTRSLEREKESNPSCTLW